MELLSCSTVGCYVWLAVADVPPLALLLYNPMSLHRLPAHSLQYYGAYMRCRLKHAPASPQREVVAKLPDALVPLMMPCDGPWTDPLSVLLVSYMPLAHVWSAKKSV